MKIIPRYTLPNDYVSDEQMLYEIQRLETKLALEQARIYFLQQMHDLKYGTYNISSEKETKEEKNNFELFEFEEDPIKDWSNNKIKEIDEKFRKYGV